MIDPDDTDEVLAFASTVPPEAPDTERCYAQPEPEHEPFAIFRPVTFLPQPLDAEQAYADAIRKAIDVENAANHRMSELMLFDLSSEDLDDDCT